MKKLIIGIIYSVSIAFLLSVVARYLLLIEEKVIIPTLSDIKLDGSIANLLNVKDKTEITKTVDNTVYLNSWKLMATVVGSKSSYALVVREKESKVLKLGDMLEGYQVAVIEKDKILCTIENQDIWLNMKQDFVEQGDGKIVKVQDPTKFDLRKAMIDTELRNPDQLLQQISIVPILDGPEFKGLKVNYVREGAFLYVFGFRVGDILTKYNGRKLTSLSDAMGVYQSVLTSQKFSITVLRNNEEKELTYEVRN